MPAAGYYAKKLADLRQAWGGRCVRCNVPHVPSAGPGWQLEFAHLPGKPTGLNGRGRGMPQRYHDVKRNPASYVLLCVECHTELDGRGGRTPSAAS